MKHIAENDELLIQYLLGELSDEETERVEQRYISEPAFYEQLLAVEDDLIDAYAEGELSRSRRLSFENHFLRSPDRQARVGFSKAWMAHLARQQNPAPIEPPSPIRRPWFAFLQVESWPVAMRVAAVLLMVLAGAWLLTETLRLRNRVEQAKLERAALETKQRELEQQMDEERRHSQELSAELERERNERNQQTPSQTDQSQPGIISFFLSPGLVRGTGDANKRIIPSQARQVSLQLNFKDGGDESYSVVISTVQGREVWRTSRLKAQSRGAGKFVVVRVPASVFNSDDYIVTLMGSGSTLIGSGSTEKVAEYVFSASKR